MAPMDNGTTVLVVDDDETIVALIRDFLEAEGLHVEGAFSAGEARRILDHATVACVILDVMMPGESGFDLCRQIRRTRDVPILFLSARGDDMDKIRGLGLGGDDYIVKSASLPEVVARVKAALRRYGPRETTADAVLTFGRLALDVRAHEVRVDGKLMPFTPREFEILCLLVKHPRQVFSYDQLLDRFWSGVGSRHTAAVHMARIREKIEKDPNQPVMIVNVWGVGYRFEGKRS